MRGRGWVKETSNQNDTSEVLFEAIIKFQIKILLPASDERDSKKIIKINRNIKVKSPPY